ncbi:DMT family transporter [uncultured Ferrovibrio sp.]|jgi:drug/metabolite transporter (DMT)-like permease|uniref:DMT family transporter n=1 Tax=uncultured Ferrovibrio sp. TaxID=1576913 RepID=UPI00262E2948|nr:DMT family transporter [uncultured Ferrovibrio sp.]
MTESAAAARSNPGSPAQTISAYSLVLLTLLTLFWGVNWPIMKIALAEIPVFTFRVLCLGGGAIGLFAIALAKRMPLHIPRGHLWPLILISFFNITAWNVLVLYGLTMLPAGRTTILAFTMPLWVIPMSALVLHERLTGWKLAGLGVGLSGLIVLIAGEWEAMASAPLGVALVLGAALSWAIGTVLIKRFAVPMAAVPFVGWQMILGGIPIFVMAPLLESDRWYVYSAGSWLAALYNAAICFVFCYWAWNTLVRTLPAGVSGLSTLMIPVVGVFSSMLMLGEQPGWPEFAALILVAMALGMILKPAR